MDAIPYIGIAAFGSGQGKTRLIVALLEEFARHGLSAAVLKHGQHVSWPAEKDSSLFMQAGAKAALVVSPAGWLLSAQPPEQPDFAAALRMLQQSCQADILLVEGYKQGSQPKLLLTEECLQQQQLLPHTVAIISDTLQHVTLPCFSSTDTQGIAGFILSYCGIGGGV